MTDRKLVSVITGTYNRHDLLMGAVKNVRAQTYPHLEHVIVSDGPDDDLRELFDPRNSAWAKAGPPIRFAECGRHWSSFLAASMSTVPFMTAQWLARGDYLMWLADDERMTADHIESLVDLLEEEDADFVYPYVRLVPAPGIPMAAHIIGSDPPMKGQVTHALFRAELLDYCGFTTHVGSATDWYQIERWMQAGARWAMLPRATLEHRLDKLGEGDNFRAERRPLRGHLERMPA